MQEIPVQRGDNSVFWEITLYFERREYTMYSINNFSLINYYNHLFCIHNNNDMFVNPKILF